MIADLNDLTLEEAEAFTSKHAYKPPLRTSFASSALSKTFSPGQWGKKGGEPRCYGECSHHDRITTWYQCDKPGKVRLCDGSTWCGIHSPEAVYKREQRTIARRQSSYDHLRAKAERWQREAVQNIVFPAFLEALEAIAEGHNDPRALARETLLKWPYLRPTSTEPKQQEEEYS
jgi:hypothetical protein